MSKTYAIADLHGRFDLLEMALARITERAEPPATLVTLGDYVDRGPDSRKIIERLMAGLGCDGWRLICLKGNHEDIMWQTCRRLPGVDWWITNGGSATLISYGQQERDQADVAVVPASHLDWIEQLPLMHVDTHRVFVHAGIDPNCSLNEQDAEDVALQLPSLTTARLGGQSKFSKSTASRSRRWRSTAMPIALSMSAFGGKADMVCSYCF
jgi:serine/threonine protein phosphatase 1